MSHHICYIIVATCLHFYLTVVALRRYMAFKELALDPFYAGHGWPETAQNIYLFSIVFAIVIYLSAIYISIARTGNYANDAVVLGLRVWIGRRLERRSEQDDPAIATMSSSEVQLQPKEVENSAIRQVPMAREGSLQYYFQMGLSLIHQCAPPYFALMHLLVAYLFVLPLPILQSQLIHYNVLHPEYAWSCVLQSLFCDPAPKAVHMQYLQPSEEAIEIVNLCLAWIMLIYRYTSVFWFTSHSFALIFATLLSSVAIHNCLQMCVVSIFYKINWLSPLSYSIPLYATLQKVEIYKNYFPSGDLMIILHCVATLFILAALIPVFLYGLYHFHQQESRHLIHFVKSSSHQFQTTPLSRLMADSPTSPVEHASNMSERSTPSSYSRGATMKLSTSHFNSSQSNPLAYFNRRKSIIWIGVAMLSLATCVLSPIAVQSGRLYNILYNVKRSGVLLGYSLFTGALISTWLVVWLAFTLKSYWNMRINTTSYGFSKRSTREDIQRQSSMNSNYEGKQMTSLMGDVSDNKRENSMSQIDRLLLADQMNTNSLLHSQRLIHSSLYDSTRRSGYLLHQQHSPPPFMQSTAFNLGSSAHGSGTGDSILNLSFPQGRPNLPYNTDYEDRGNYVFLQQQMNPNNVMSHSHSQSPTPLSHYSNAPPVVPAHLVTLSRADLQSYGTSSRGYFVMPSPGLHQQDTPEYTRQGSLTMQTLMGNNSPPVSPNQSQLPIYVNEQILSNLTSSLPESTRFNFQHPQESSTINTPNSHISMDVKKARDYEFSINGKGHDGIGSSPINNTHPEMMSSQFDANIFSLIDTNGVGSVIESSPAQCGSLIKPRRPLQRIVTFKEDQTTLDTKMQVLSETTTLMQPPNDENDGRLDTLLGGNKERIALDPMKNVTSPTITSGHLSQPLNVVSGVTSDQTDFNNEGLCSQV